MTVMLKAQDVQEAKTAYLAGVMWSLGKMLGGDNYPIPPYTEVFHKEEHMKKNDRRGTKQIVNDLVNRLKGGGAGG